MQLSSTSGRIKTREKRKHGEVSSYCDKDNIAVYEREKENFHALYSETKTAKKRRQENHPHDEEGMKIIYDKNRRYQYIT